MRQKGATVISQEDMAIQKRCTEQVATHFYKPKSFFVITYGCQMNAHDSEKLSGMLEQMGIAPAASKEEADFVIYNTCCIRENAERRALGNVTWLKELRKKKPSLIIAVCGCMIQQAGMADKILKQYKFIDLAFGTHNLFRFPELMLRSLDTRRQVVEVLSDGEFIDEGLPVKRLNDYHAYITIMYGCDNFCSYCIVPYVRGRERSRESKAILEEAKALYKSGVKEIMLLGQNVNSYGNDMVDGTSFPELLKSLDSIGIERIRFMTSHPKDLSDELVEVIVNAKHICPQFHLPVQSGSNEILAKMNRKYTRESYLDKVDMLRKRIPGIGLSTDLIVGFPGETEAQFQETLSLAKQVRFDAAFMFVYSPRVGTRAASMPDQLPSDITKDRIMRLIALQDAITKEVHASLVGQTEMVLVDAVAKKEQNAVTGKGLRGISITLPGDESDIGKIIPVVITKARATVLIAQRQDK